MLRRGARFYTAFYVKLSFLFNPYRHKASVRRPLLFLLHIFTLPLFHILLLYLLFLPSSLLLFLSFLAFQCHDAGSDRAKHHVTPHSPRLGSSLLACSALIHHARRFLLCRQHFLELRVLGLVHRTVF
jgi:hypothetical protein